MNKNIFAGVVALLIVLGFGIWEVVAVSGRYSDMEQKCQQLIEKTEQRTITMQEFEQFSDEWQKLRVVSELLLPHNDVYEVNLRMSEVNGYLTGKAYDDALTQLKVIKTLLEYIPDNVIPDFHHIV